MYIYVPIFLDTTLSCIACACVSLFSFAWYWPICINMNNNSPFVVKILFFPANRLYYHQNVTLCVCVFCLEIILSFFQKLWKLLPSFIDSFLLILACIIEEIAIYMEQRFEAFTWTNASRSSGCSFCQQVIVKYLCWGLAFVNLKKIAKKNLYSFIEVLKK